MADREPPEIKLTSTSSAPRTSHNGRTSYTIASRRGPNDMVDTNTNNQQQLHPTATGYNHNNNVEPFPSLPTPTPMQTPGNDLSQYRTADGYFAQPPLQYQVRTRPIGIRRLPSSNDVQGETLQRTRSGSGLRRRRTNTAPSRDQPPPAPSENATAGLSGLPGHYELGASPGGHGMDTIVEGQQTQQAQSEAVGGVDNRPGRSASKRHRLSDATRSVLSKLSDDHEEDDLRQRRARPGNGRDYESDVVDYLDVLDPEVSTLTTLNNIQNSMFVPDIPFLNRYYNRRPTYELTRGPSRRAEQSHEEGALRPQVARGMSRQVNRKPVPPTPEPPEVPPKSDGQSRRIDQVGSSRTPEPGMTSTDNLNRRNSLASITSHVEDDHYAVLPHGVSLEGWSQDDVDTLDDYVRHMLHSRRSRFKRGFKGFGKYIRKPLGFFVTLYAFLITIFGFIWVLFLIGWVSLPGNRKDYIIHIVDSVLVALFAVMGDGLAPFRAIDTYHMVFIAHYHRLSWKLRAQKNLPKLADHNDLPERTQHDIIADAEAGVLDEKRGDADWEFSVLTQEQQRKLVHHQNKFSKSHSYYRPHETTTHHAFPLKLLITIVSLLDAHSLLQISLGAFTWGWSYHTRPQWITAVILSISITVNITAGVLISVGDKRTRKKDVLLRMARQGLTEEAMRKVEKRKREEEGDAEAAKIKAAADLAGLANITQGVREPKGEEFKEGVEHVKEKLKVYRSVVEEGGEMGGAEGMDREGSGSGSGSGSGEEARKKSKEERKVERDLSANDYGNSDTGLYSDKYRSDGSWQEEDGTSGNRSRSGDQSGNGRRRIY